jgi:hypothetical protein
MSHFEKFFHTSTGRIIMSIVLGFGLSSLFRRVCNNYNCVHFVAPSLNKIQNKIFAFGNKCISYSYVPTKCPSDAHQILPFESGQVLL